MRLPRLEYFDHLLRRTDINLLADEAVRHGIEEGLELDMVVSGHTGQTPFGEFVILGWQACQRRSFDRFEEMAAADAEAAYDVVVDTLDRLFDRSVGFGQREEGHVAQTPENATLGEADSVLYDGLVLWAPGPGRQHSHAVMGGHLAVTAVDLRIVERGGG